jgi:hypothetical protein
VVQIHIHFFQCFFSPCSFNQQTLVIDWPSDSQAQQYYSAWSFNIDCAGERWSLLCICNV